jgi:ABC-type multidrug transport system permease subunit
MPHSTVLVGRAVAQLAITALTTVVTMLVSYAVGFRPAAGFDRLLPVLLLCLLVGAAFTWVFIAVGLATGNAQAAQGVAFLVMPLSFVSSAYVPTASMPGWLQVFAAHQPLTDAVNAARFLAHGPAGVAQLPYAGAHYVAATVAWCIGILAVTVPLSGALFWRR